MCFYKILAYMKIHTILYISGSPFHTVSNFDKRILVWVKRYPSIDQVPAKVS